MTFGYLSASGFGFGLLIVSRVADKILANWKKEANAGRFGGRRVLSVL